MYRSWDIYKNCSYAIKVDLLADTSNPCSEQITIKSHRTRVFLCQMGLRQGCNLSPLLASIYPADLHSILDEKKKTLNSCWMRPSPTSDLFCRDK